MGKKSAKSKRGRGRIKKRATAKENDVLKTSNDQRQEVVIKEKGQKNKRKVALDHEETNVEVPKKKRTLMKGFRESIMCHQCQRNDKGRVVRCNNCKTKRYCTGCLTKWYPGSTEAEIEEKCPVCCNNCNCKLCLRMKGECKSPMKKISEADQFKYLCYNLLNLLPWFKEFHRRQCLEKKLEAKIRGLSSANFKLNQALCEDDEGVYCNICSTSIIDYHRSCPSCSFDLCLCCCREIREGDVLAGDYVSPPQYIGQGKEYWHRGHPSSSKNELNTKEEDRPQALSEWKANGDGSISCPPKEIGGCHSALLELKCMFLEKELQVLMEDTKSIIATGEYTNMCDKFEEVMVNTGCEVDYKILYCPMARDVEKDEGLEQFQMHWAIGMPVIVRDVLEFTYGLSWEPMVLWRALRETKPIAESEGAHVKAINCLDWSEVEINIRQFFNGYAEGRGDRDGWPEMLKLKEWGSSTFNNKRLPRHGAEFIMALPFKEYTDPRSGVLNLAAMLPHNMMKPNLCPKTYVAYGFLQELERGDSITKLHFHMTDVVNILMHTAEVIPSPGQLAVIENLKKEHKDQDAKEKQVTIKTNSKDEFELFDGLDIGDKACGAIWDIFKRDDVLKIEDYLRKHCTEFRDVICAPIEKVCHPIHDQSFYINMKHKRKLKEEHGIEPWTFVQKIGEAVLIPAGCPHQVRNLRSCIKVALDFVSPENVREYERLTKELRVLPKGHRAKVDELEVMKIAIHALIKVVSDIKDYMTNSKSSV